MQHFRFPHQKKSTNVTTDSNPRHIILPIPSSARSYLKGSTSVRPRIRTLVHHYRSRLIPLGFLSPKTTHRNEMTDLNPGSNIFNSLLTTLVFFHSKGPTTMRSRVRNREATDSQSRLNQPGFHSPVQTHHKETTDSNPP